MNRLKCRSIDFLKMSEMINFSERNTNSSLFFPFSIFVTCCQFEANSFIIKRKNKIKDKPLKPLRFFSFHENKENTNEKQKTLREEERKGDKRRTKKKREREGKKRVKIMYNLDSIVQTFSFFSPFHPRASIFNANNRRMRYTRLTRVIPRI